MTDNQSQDERFRNKRYLHLASATEESVDAFIDSLFEAAHNGHSVNPTQVVKKTLAASQVDPTLITQMWTQIAKTGDREGVLAVVQLQSGEWVDVISCPVIPLAQGERALQSEALAEVLALAEGVIPECVTVKDDYLHYSVSHVLTALEEGDINHAFRRLHNHLQGVKNALIIAYDRYFGADEAAIAQMILIPVLPDIRLSDQDAERMNSFLLQADQQVRDLFIYLMEGWFKRGYIVGTTPKSIVLDAPYGEHGGRVRLAILLPGLSQNVANYFEGEGYEPIPPSIILRWASLRDQEGILPDAFAAYQQAVEEALTLRLTASSAHVQEVISLDHAAIDQLVDNMDALVGNIDHSAVKPKTRAPRTTPSRLKSTLNLCDPHTRAFFNRLIQAWQVIGGLVQSPRIGRVYLKMQTRAHNSGDLARIARRFNLLTLVCPHQGSRATIQVAWSLADGTHPAAYLDCIPDAVASFEKTVSGLPGFEQRGTITRLTVDETYTQEHMDRMVQAVMTLKSAEKNAS